MSEVMRYMIVFAYAKSPHIMYARTRNNILGFDALPCVFHKIHQPTTLVRNSPCSGQIPRRSHERPNARPLAGGKPHTA